MHTKFRCCKLVMYNRLLLQYNSHVATYFIIYNLLYGNVFGILTCVALVANGNQERSMKLSEQLKTSCTAQRKGTWMHH